MERDTAKRSNSPSLSSPPFPYDDDLLASRVEEMQQPSHCKQPRECLAPFRGLCLSISLNEMVPRDHLRRRWIVIL